VKADELNALYQESCAVIMPYIRLEGEGTERGDPSHSEANLQKGIKGLEAVLEHNPTNWSARWMLGKAKQALGLHEESYTAFLTAHRSVLTNQNVMRELALECLQTKRFTQAVHYCHVAMEFDPDDYSLWSNMAVAQLFNGNIEKAESWANKSLAKTPGDEPAMNVLKIIAEIRAGKRGIPTDFTLMEKET
jgi:tetratricopeptide (TPR) repeat protein